MSEQTKAKTAEDRLNLVIRLLKIRNSTYNLFGRKKYAFEKSFLKNLTDVGIFVVDVDHIDSLLIDKENLEAKNKELIDLLRRSYDAIDVVGHNGLFYDIEGILRENHNES